MNEVKRRRKSEQGSEQKQKAEDSLKQQTEAEELKHGW